MVLRIRTQVSQSIEQMSLQFKPESQNQFECTYLRTIEIEYHWERMKLELELNWKNTSQGKKSKLTIGGEPRTNLE